MIQTLGRFQALRGNEGHRNRGSLQEIDKIIKKFESTRIVTDVMTYFNQDYGVASHPI